jgi:hypothetical protein
MHLPIRRFIIVSHRGSIVCGFAGALSKLALRGSCTGEVVESRRRAGNWHERIGAASWVRSAGCSMACVERRELRIGGDRSTNPRNLGQFGLNPARLYTVSVMLILTLYNLDRSSGY